MKLFKSLITVVILAGALEVSGAITNQHVYLSGTNTFSSSVENQVTFFWHPGKRAMRAGFTPAGSNNFKDSLIGNFSLAFGNNPKASGTGAVAIGDGAEASWYHSLAIGSMVRATQGYSVAIGQAEWDYNNGLRTESTAEAAFALGTGVVVSGSNSISAGLLNTTISSCAANFGSSNYTSSFAGFVAGYNNNVNYSYSGALGFNSIVQAGTSFAMGRSLLSYSQDCFVVGRFNDPIKTTDHNISEDRPVFIVGNGSGSGGTPRKNALVVLADGTIRINRQGDLFMGEFGLAGDQAP